MKTRSPLSMLAGLFSLVAVATPAGANTLAVDINESFTTSSGDAGNNSFGPLTIGYAFTLGQEVTVTSLGVLDYVNSSTSGDGAALGLVESHDVAIWGATSGTLLASGTVRAGAAGSCLISVATASPLEESSWCFVDIVDVTLAPGEYVIGAFYVEGLDIYRSLMPANHLSVVSGMTLDGARINFGSFGFPGSNASGTYGSGIFGPNFQIAAAAVPEPGTLALLCLGLAGLGLSRRRKAA